MTSKWAMIETIILWIGLTLAAAGLALALRSDVPYIRGETRRVMAKVVRHHRVRGDGGFMYSAVLLFPDEAGRLIEVRDPLMTPFPKPVIGEVVEIVHPAGLPKKARIPHPWFRTLMYGGLGYAFVVIGLEVTGELLSKVVSGKLVMRLGCRPCSPRFHL